MDDRNRIRVGRALGGTAVGVGVVSAGIVAALGGSDFLIQGFALQSVVAAVGFGGLTWVAVGAQPRNREVWTLAAAAGFAAGAVTSVAVTVAWGWASIPDFTYDVAVRTGLSPADAPAVVGVLGGAGTSWAFGAALFVVLTLGLLWFPDGELPSPRWRWVVWFSVAAILIESGLSSLWAGMPWSTVPLFGFDVGSAGTNEALEVVALASIALPVTAALFSIGSLISRYRTSPAVVRRQILWIGWGGAILVIVVSAVLTTVIFGLFDVANSPFRDAILALMVSAGVAALIMSFAVAILRYRLYDIDLVISKTVTYGALAVFITVVYVVIVVGVGGLVGGGGEPNVVLAVGATAVVALLFEPIRSRVQRWANRVVYGERATPYAVLSELTARYAVGESDEEALGRLAGLVASGTGASQSVVWLRVGDRLRPEAVVGGGGAPGSVRLTGGGGGLPDLGGEVAEPIVHGGELLGALSIAKDRSDPVSPADRQLLADVAAGAGLLLRNIRLNAELADRADELRVSRRRLVAAQDAERRRLERNLHDGAQQQVVALKVKLGLARTLAEREDAAEIAAAVADLAADTQRAVDGMRTVARGIYPPLLEAEGLGAALLAVARDASFPVEVDADGVGRYPAEVEATVYFSVLEAVNQSAAPPSGVARVQVSDDAGVLGFTVDGVTVTGAGLIAAADRIDALGGTLTTDTATGTITGRLPTTALEPA
jgi:signal transduction histidine kinase